MREPEDLERARREADAARVKEKEGTGTVPNVTPGPGGGTVEELKKAAHQLEEEKGDWAKDH